MFRLVIIAIWIYAIYRGLKWALIALGTGSDRGHLDTDSEPTGVNQMVKDPVCGTYVLARDATRSRIHGKTYFFCSDECRKRFVNN